MLRSLPETLLKYTCEGVIIRARYIRQLDKIHKINLATKNSAKKFILDTNKELESKRALFIKQSYSEGLKALLADILRFCAQYQDKLLQDEIKQREQITATIAQFFQSPEIQLELTQRLIATSPADKKITLEIPATLKDHLEKALNNQNIEFITHNSTVISINTGDQIAFFDPALLMRDLQSQFHQPFSESYQPVFNQEIKDLLINYITKFDVLDETQLSNDSDPYIKSEVNDED
ncbi:type III secretion protein [Proteus hauseri]|uniref:type III secretion protein n=1 Tax=Proteus hauseri TaxID=183417 RepID=UPI0032DB7132